MFKLKKSMLFIVIVTLLLSGCGATESEPKGETREVSSEKRYMGIGAGLEVEEGDLKESGVSYEDRAIAFQDSVVEEMLRNIIGKPEGEVYISELQDIHAIYWRGSGSYWSNLQSPDGKLSHWSGNEGPWETKEQPSNLNDLAYCYNLQWMEFGSKVEVPSLKPLYDLPQLETLSFSGAIVTEEVLEEIGKLPMLKNLTVGYYEAGLEAYGSTNWGDLTDGSFLIPLANQLTYLFAAGNIDWNPEVLAKMKKLETLRIYDKDDVSFLEELTELKNLSLYCCAPKNWSSLAAPEKLEHLEIRGNMKQIVDIALDDLRSLTQLDYLCVTYTSINDEYSNQEIIDALPSLTGLVTVVK